MMSNVTPRRWDVVRCAALVIALATASTACGSARVAAPPEPEFTTGQRAQPTVLPEVTIEPVEQIELDLSSIEADLDPVSVDQMTIVDDAGNVAPNHSGWETFDTSLEHQLIPADVSASVAVMIDGQILHEAAFGERIRGTGDPVETTDRFRIASISKTVTAIVALRLVEQGVLVLDDPVGERVVQHLGLAQFDPDVSRITLRNLLSHTAGFPDHSSTFFNNGATSCVDAAMQGLASSVAGPSGYNYSNMSFCVLGLLIEAVTGMTYEQVAYEQLLTPLGISGMRITSTYDLGPDEVSHHPTPNRNYMETLGGAGGWNATPADLVTIINSIDPKTSGWKALSPELMEAMRYHLPTDQPPSGYGLGLINFADGAFGHTGTIQNTHAMLVVQPDGVTWAVTVSGEYPGSTSALQNIVRQALSDGFSPI
jgi:D-alanyl-D-alanine carboxypeptidase